MTTFCNEERKWYVYSAPKIIFYAILIDTKIDESVTKKNFPDVQMLPYRGRSATVGSSIMMELLFACLT